MNEPSPLRQLGLVVHPTRPVESAVEEIGAWASAHGLTVGQVPVPGQTRQVAEPVEALAPATPRSSPSPGKSRGS